MTSSLPEAAGPSALESVAGRGEAPVVKAATGIAGFDEITRGGLPAHRTTLIVGGPGAGKTVFALQTLVTAARKYREPGIFVAFEESSRQIVGNAATFGVGPARARARTTLLPRRCVCRRPPCKRATSTSRECSPAFEAKANEMGAKRIVFDGIDVLLTLLSDPTKERREMYRLQEWLNANGLTAMITAKAGDSETTAAERYSFMQFMVDAVITLHHRMLDRVSLRGVRIMKYRGSGFSEGEFPMVITPSGIEVATFGTSELDFDVSTERISTGVARLGNPVIYVGANTGRDGIHGASMASAEFTEESKQKRPNVQVGDPFMEKLLLEACLEAMQTGAIVGIQDMGAAGLTCSTCEMGSRGEVGHRNRAGPRAAARNRHDALRDHALRIAGAHAAGGRQGPRGRSLPRVPQVGPGSRRDRRSSPATASCACAITARSSPRFPIANWPTKRRSTTARTRTPLRTRADRRAALAAAPMCRRLCPRCWPPPTSAPSAGSGSSTITWSAPTRSPGPGGDAAIVRIKETGTSVAMSLDGNGRYCYLSPREGAKLAVAECCRNLSTVGAQPVAATNCLNFGNPERPEIMAQLVEAIEGMAEACRFFDTPITGGNVSLYNETLGEGIYPDAGDGHRGADEDRARR